MAIDIRSLGPSDRPAWDVLWAGYLAFYETDLAPAVTELTWSRLHDPAEMTQGFGAFDGDDLVGICHFLMHRSTWARGWYCYLEDLFTDPRHRGRGVARMLIEATGDRARAAGAEKLYWQTHTSNVVARSLYDQVAAHEGFVVYERAIR